MICGVGGCLAPLNRLDPLLEVHEDLGEKNETVHVPVPVPCTRPLDLSEISWRLKPQGPRDLFSHNHPPPPHPGRNIT